MASLKSVAGMTVTNFEIQQQFNSILEYTQGCAAKTDKLFEAWWLNKSKLRAMLGGELIKNYGYTEFHLTSKEKKALINQFLEMASVHLPDNEYTIFEDFIFKNRDTFFANMVSEVTLPIDQAKDFKQGMKLVKAFKFFISDHVALRRLQEYASSIIQKEKISGEFCVSIHPLDFLTSSVNTYNWRSCHALDGEYRAGNLSYMADNVTLMCYLKGEDVLRSPQLPSGITWNSKKWRMLVHIDPSEQLCFLGRQYPYTLSGIEEVVHRLILPSHASWKPFMDSYISSIDVGDDKLNLDDKYYAIASRNPGTSMKLVKLHDLVRDYNQTSPLHFNDLLFSHCYEPMYSSRWVFDEENYPPQLVIGADVPCICCENNYIYAESNHMLCKDCAIEMGYLDDDSEDEYYENDEEIE